MKKIRILTVFGTRPEAIKMAPVVRALEQSEHFHHVLCVTAQHRDMLDQILELFALRPRHDLDLMRPGQDLYHLTAAVILGIQGVLALEKPDLVLVHGDTTTTFAATLASFYARVPVGHVEAGLRTGNLAAPFPEEANRVLADRLCTYLFPPTSRARDVLLCEGCEPDRVWVTGNTVIDALLDVRSRLDTLQVDNACFGSAWPVMRNPRVPVILVTGHRRESFGQGFRDICTALRRISQRHPGVHIVYPVHLNPNVRRPVNEHLSGLENVHLIPPLGYAPFIRLMDRARFVLTDSGGIQEEAPSLGKPVLVMRDTTERPEGVQAGTVKLVGTSVQRIVAESERLLLDEQAYQVMHRAHNPYGDGKAAARIRDVLAESFQVAAGC